ncbi:hypothetical protein A2U01_0039763, partial [Trifolium medium]|nr:hypothetical protein [Trifolium medium]
MDEEGSSRSLPPAFLMDEEGSPRSLPPVQQQIMDEAGSPEPSFGITAFTGDDYIP